LLVVIALVLLFAHDPATQGQLLLSGTAQLVGGVVAGFALGVVASLLGVAGGELRIYSADRRFSVLGKNQRFVLAMAAGSLVGAFLGGQLLRVLPGTVLLPFLALLLGSPFSRPGSIGRVGYSRPFAILFCLGAKRRVQPSTRLRFSVGR
jgi:uncharacterized membrane protein YfcA